MRWDWAPRMEAKQKWNDSPLLCRHWTIILMNAVISLSSVVLLKHITSGASFTMDSPACPVTPPDNICTPALMHMSAGEMSDSMFPMEVTRRRNSGLLSPLPPLQNSQNQYWYAPMATRNSSWYHKRWSAKENYGSDDEEEDLQPAQSANNDVSFLQGMAETLKGESGNCR